MSCPPALQPVLDVALGVVDRRVELVGEDEPSLIGHVVLNQDLRRERIGVDRDYAEQRMVRALVELVLGAHDDVLVLQTDPVGLPGAPPTIKLRRGLLGPTFRGLPKDRLGGLSLRVRSTGFVLLRALVPVDRPVPPAVEKRFAELVVRLPVGPIPGNTVFGEDPAFFLLSDLYL